MPCFLMKMQEMQTYKKKRNPTLAYLSVFLTLDEALSNPAVVLKLSASPIVAIEAV